MTEFGGGRRFTASDERERETAVREKGNATDLVSTAVIVVMMRRESRDNSDTELVRRLFHFGRGVGIHRGCLVRGVIYDEIRVVVFSDGDRNDPHAGSRTGGGVE